uniref:Uncharacterized protein n=1 Tax=Vespula pensylvanica TaxID=30213 RepID=A0A834U8Y4_VESPE|nr:hypothetical protein H0235_009953 [Vespula pensylvanica]
MNSAGGVTLKTIGLRLTNAGSEERGVVECREMRKEGKNEKEGGGVAECFESVMVVVVVVGAASNSTRREESEKGVLYAGNYSG